MTVPGRRHGLYLLLGILALLIASLWIAYYAAGRSAIADLHSGRVQSFGGISLEGRGQFPLDYYYRQAQNTLALASVLLVVAALFLYYAIAERREILAVLRAERKWSAVALRRHPLSRSSWPIMLGMAAAFLVFYLWLGARFTGSPALSEDSLLFEADPLLTAHDMTVFGDRYYSTPSRHPLFVLLLNPPGSMLAEVFDPFLVARVLNALCGAAGVALAFAVFQLWHPKPSRSALLAILFGLSMSQLFFGSLPETYSFAACSLLVICGLTILSIRERIVDFWPWVIAGVLATGVTATNVAQAVICFAFAAAAATTKRLTARVMAYGLTVGAIVAVLSLVQTVLYPAADLFFWPFDQRVSLGYVDFSPLLHPFDLAARELKHFVLVNVAGAVPAAVPWPGTDLPALTYDTPLIFTPLGWTAAALWMLLFAIGTLTVRRSSDGDRSILRAILACVLFNFVLHAIYGTGGTGRVEFFLYSAHWTFAVLFLVTAALRGRAASLLLATLSLFLLLNNTGILRHILAAYR